MIIVNLVPEESRPKVKTPIPYMVSVLIFLVALAGMGWLWVSFQEKVGAQRAELAKYEEALGEYGNVVDQYNEIEEQKLGLVEKIDIINEIVSDRIIWSKELWRLSKLTPENVWYNGIDVVERTSTVVVTVYDPKKQKDIEKKQRIKLPILEVKGYVVADEDGKMGISPLMFNLRDVPVPDPDEEDAGPAHENDVLTADSPGTKFSKRFRLRDHDWENVDFSGVPALAFTLEFEIKTGEGPEND